MSDAPSLPRKPLLAKPLTRKPAEAQGAGPAAPPAPVPQAPEAPAAEAYGPPEASDTGPRAPGADAAGQAAGGGLLDRLGPLKPLAGKLEALRPLTDKLDTLRPHIERVKPLKPLVEKLGTGPLLAGAAFVGFLTLGTGYFLCSSAGGAARAMAGEGDPSAAQALGSKIRCKEARGTRVTPLVVDWPAEERTDLELAMKDGIAVVEHTCESLRVLPGCSLKGGYRFSGVQPKEEIRQLANADEFAATLPRSTTGKAALGLSAELARGNTLDIATIMIGKQRTVVDEVSRSELQGKCTGATHIVRGASVGAFAKDTGKKGKVKASADLFGAGSTTSSTASSMSRSVDGSIAACKSATADDARPPPQCGSVVSLELIPISEQENAGRTAERGDRDGAACPAGMVFAENKCTHKEDVKNFQCEESDFQTCEEQCNKGNARSCVLLADLFRFDFLPDGKKNPRVSKEESYKASRKACDLGDKGSCSVLANAQLNQGKMDASTARKIMEDGVAQGDTRSRLMLGMNLVSEGKDNQGRPLNFPTDPGRGLRLLGQACDAGDKHGCMSFGTSFFQIKQNPATRDKVKVSKEQYRAVIAANEHHCKKNPGNCSIVGLMYAFATEDLDGRKDTRVSSLERLAIGLPYLRKSCSAGGSLGENACKIIQGYKEKFTSKDVEDLEKACAAPGAAGCELLAPLRKVVAELR